ncbi:MAG TPA: translation initiation factor IF-2 N-terminal domain-containing protein, partial [Longimicrobiaceae bacterium]|nr:translation initiation factor IF-2 N-terminal domain-containing protein [Longimicrobiaceae bacterium]
MRVYELAKELNVSAEALVHLLREMDIPVRSHMTPLADEHVARLRTVLERERRLGHRNLDEAVSAAIGDVAQAPKRRRRVREASEGGDDEQDSTASATADAAEAIAADAAEAAAERGAPLVTTGGEPPRGVTVIVEDAAPAAPAEEAPAPAAPIPVRPRVEKPAAPVAAEAHPAPQAAAPVEAP